MSLAATQKRVLFCYLGVTDGKLMFYALTTSRIITALRLCGHSVMLQVCLPFLPFIHLRAFIFLFKVSYFRKFFIFMLCKYGT